MLAVGQNSLSGNLKSRDWTFTADMSSPPVIRFTTMEPTPSFRQSSEMTAAPIWDSSRRLTGVLSRSQGSTSGSVLRGSSVQAKRAGTRSAARAVRKTNFFIIL